MPPSVSPEAFTAHLAAIATAPAAAPADQLPRLRRLLEQLLRAECQRREAPFADLSQAIGLVAYDHNLPPLLRQQLQNLRLQANLVLHESYPGTPAEVATGFGAVAALLGHLGGQPYAGPRPPGEAAGAVGAQPPTGATPPVPAAIPVWRVRVLHADLAGGPAPGREFAREIVPPPLIRPRGLALAFDRPVAGSLLDAEGAGIGLTRRLAGTGGALPGRDANLRLRTDRRALELTTTRSDLNEQVGLDRGEYLGVGLAELGFTGAEDFAISAEVTAIPGLDVVGQFGLYAGVRSDRAIRGGVLRQREVDRYGLFLVNNVNGIDQDINEVGVTTTGDDLRFTLRRVDGAYSFRVDNLTRRSSNTLTIPPSPSLEGTAQLDVGLFGANTQSDVRKTLTIRRVEVTVFTRAGVAPALARAVPGEARPPR